MVTGTVYNNGHQHSTKYSRHRWTLVSPAFRFLMVATRWKPSSSSDIRVERRLWRHINASYQCSLTQDSKSDLLLISIEPFSAPALTMSQGSTSLPTKHKLNNMNTITCALALMEPIGETCVLPVCKANNWQHLLLLGKAVQRRSGSSWIKCIFSSSQVPILNFASVQAYIGIN